jgi:hypothetical protein
VKKKKKKAAAKRAAAAKKNPVKKEEKRGDKKRRVRKLRACARLPSANDEVLSLHATDTLVAVAVAPNLGCAKTLGRMRLDMSPSTCIVVPAVA